MRYVCTTYMRLTRAYKLGSKGTKKIPHMQAYAGKSAKKVHFVRDLAHFGVF